MFPAAPLRILAFLLVLVSLAGFAGCEREVPSKMHGIHLPEPLEMPDLTLYDTAGKPFHLLEETEGRLSLIFFGYTHCPDICPLHMANIAAVLKDMSFTEQAKVRVIFVSVDPARDTPERLSSWLHQFNPYFVGVTAPEPVLREFEAAVNAPNAITYPEDGGGYAVGHATQVMAFEPNGEARYVYPFGTRQRDWAADLPHLLPKKKMSAPPLQARVTAREDVEKGAVKTLVVDRVVIPTPPPGGPGALYATVSNGESDDELVAITVAGVKKAELHESMQMKHSDGAHDHGGMKMSKVESFPVAAGATLELRPGAKHGMLMKLAEDFGSAGTAAVEFRFRKAGTKKAVARIVSYEELESALTEEVAE